MIWGDIKKSNLSTLIKINLSIIFLVTVLTTASCGSADSKLERLIPKVTSVALVRLDNALQITAIGTANQSVWKNPNLVVVNSSQRT